MVNDIHFTREQADLIKENSGFEVDEKLIHDPEPDIMIPGAERATSLYAREWTLHPDGNGMYEMPFEFWNYPEESKVKVREHVQEFERVTCVKMIEIENGVTENYSDYTNKIRVIEGEDLPGDESNPGCWSYVGRISQWSQQDLSLSSWCTSSSTIQHEFVHALGFWHEQQRMDLDKPGVYIFFLVYSLSSIL